MTEAEFLAALRTLPLHPGAQGLTDDAARLGDLVLTTDTLVEGVHFLPHDPPESVGWKLAAVNLSDLAAKGAVPVGVLLNSPLIRSGDRWDEHFLAGLTAALTRFSAPLLGGDTVSLPAGAPRVLTLTAIGKAGACVPMRSGASAGDALWVTGTIGAAGAGLALARDGKAAPAAVIDRYRRPQPRLAEGEALAPLVTAMMDVSDGLLIDAERMAAASALAVTIALDSVPVDPAAARDPLGAVTAGDDYELLFALPPRIEPPVAATRIGTFHTGQGLTLTRDGAPIDLPDRLGWQHGIS